MVLNGLAATLVVLPFGKNIPLYRFRLSTTQNSALCPAKSKIRISAHKLQNWHWLEITMGNTKRVWLVVQEWGDVCICLQSTDLIPVQFSTEVVLDPSSAICHCWNIQSSRAVPRETTLPHRTKDHCHIIIATDSTIVCLTNDWISH